MNKGQVTERVKRYLAAGVNPPVIWDEEDGAIWLAIDLAAAELAAQIARDPARRYLLERMFAVAAVTNYVALGTVDADYDLLADTLKEGQVYDPVQRVTYHLAHSLFEMQGWVPPGWNFYAIENDKLYLRPADTSWEDSASVMSGASIQFSCVAQPKSLANWDDRLEEDMVLKTAEILLRKPVSQVPNE